jgi:hypothetical protein
MQYLFRAAKQFTALSLGNQFPSIGINKFVFDSHAHVMPNVAGITQRQECSHVYENEILSIDEVNGSQSFNSKGCSRGWSGNSCMGYRSVK